MTAPPAGTVTASTPGTLTASAAVTAAAVPLRFSAHSSNWAVSTVPVITAVSMAASGKDLFEKLIVLSYRLGMV
jgi:hypothetical protein